MWHKKLNKGVKYIYIMLEDPNRTLLVNFSTYLALENHIRAIQQKPKLVQDSLEFDEFVKKHRLSVNSTDLIRIDRRTFSMEYSSLKRWLTLEGFSFTEDGLVR